MRNFILAIVGLVVVTFGVTLVLENLNVIDFSAGEIWLYGYPTFFVLYGIKLMIDRLRKKGGSFVIGSFLFVFGSLILLGRFDLVEFAFKDIYKLWPMIIVYIGIAILKRMGKKNHYHTYTKYYHVHDEDRDRKKEEANQNNHEDSTRFDSHEYNGNDKYHEKTSFFSIGDYNYSSENWLVTPLNLKSMAGDYYFDFTKAFIPEKHLPISIKSQAGDVHMIIPKHVEFRVYAVVKAGDIDIVNQSVSGINRSLKYETENYDTSVQKLDIYISLAAGAVRIDHI